MANDEKKGDVEKKEEKVEQPSTQGEMGKRHQEATRTWRQEQVQESQKMHKELHEIADKRDALNKQIKEAEKSKSKSESEIAKMKEDSDALFKEHLEKGAEAGRQDRRATSAAAWERQVESDIRELERERKRLKEEEERKRELMEAERKGPSRPRWVQSHQMDVKLAGGVLNQNRFDDKIKEMGAGYITNGKVIEITLASNSKVVWDRASNKVRFSDYSEETLLATAKALQAAGATSVNVANLPDNKTKSIAWQTAKSVGLDVEGYKPSAEDEQRLRMQQGSAQKK